MAGLKEIRRRIRSVQNTMQITRAMKLVSAAKLRKAEEAAENGRAFSEKLEGVFQSLRHDLEGSFSHALMEPPAEGLPNRVIVIAGERGLCGAFNANVVKAVEAGEMKQEVTPEFVLIGRRAVAAATRANWSVVESHDGLSENACEWPTEEIVEKLICDYKAKKCAKVILYYTKFVSAMRQEVSSEVLLPFSAGSGEPSDLAQIERKHDPEPEKILKQLIPVLLRTKIVQAGLETKASEHAARMTAMDSATNNAGELIEKLRLFYNRARQSAITTELIDIVGGAEALN